MTKFICSANGKNMFNVEKIQRIFRVHDVMTQKVTRALLGQPLGAGIQCEISTHDKLVTAPLITLYEVEEKAQIILLSHKAERYLRALTYKKAIDDLLTILMFELQDQLMEGIAVIETCKVIESAIVTHQLDLFNDDMKFERLKSASENKAKPTPKSYTYRDIFDCIKYKAHRRAARNDTSD
ncbi:MAG: hypothetical protein WCL71_09315 [Deltaproteobacteria bacterium]